MSASREKKQRQGSGPSEREVQAQKQTAAYQRKVRTYTIIGVVVVILVAALLIWNSGIFQRNQIAATVGDTNYTVNDVSYYYQTVRYNTFLYSYYITGTMPSDDDVMDAESGQTYREYFLEQSLEGLTELTALYDKAIENGYSEKDVADTVQAQIDSIKSSASSSGYSYGAYLKTQYGRYMTASAVKSILTKAAVADAYYNDYADSLTYTDEEIQQYYEENKNTLDTYEYSFLYFTPGEIATAEGVELTDDETALLTAQALAVAEDNAAHALDQLNDGSTVAEVAEEYELSSTAVGDHLTKLGSSIATYYNEEMYALAEGEATMVANGDSGYYVIMLHSRTLVETPNADVCHILISAETTTDEDGNLVEPTDEAWAAALEKAEDVLAEYEAGEQTQEAFIALAEKYSADKDADGNLNNGGLYSNIPSTSTSYVTEFMSWIFGDEAHSVGDTGIIQHVAGGTDSNNYYGYHIMYYAGDEDPVWKQTAISALQSDDISAWLEELESGYTAALASGADHVAN